MLIIILYKTGESLTTARRQVTTNLNPALTGYAAVRDSYLGVILFGTANVANIFDNAKQSKVKPPFRGSRNGNTLIILFSGPHPVCEPASKRDGRRLCRPHLHQPFIRKAVIAAATDYHVVHQSDVK